RFSHRLFDALEDGHLLINIPYRNEDILALRAQLREASVMPVSERDPVTGLLTANQFRRELQHRPRQFVYLIGVSSWHRGDAGERALHRVNEVLGQDAVSRAITAFANALNRELG